MTNAEVQVKYEVKQQITDGEQSQDLPMEDLPLFLQSFENLTGHFDEHFGEFDSNQRGDSFLALASKLVPLTDEALNFGKPKVSERKSHDKGVDLFTVANENKERLCIQSKYKIRERSEFDTIISKFNDFEIHAAGKKEGLFQFFTESEDASPKIHFMIVTSSKLDGILASYKSSHLASKVYFETLRGYPGTTSEFCRYLNGFSFPGFGLNRLSI